MNNGERTFSILAVDDTPENLHVLMEALKGWRVRTARDGRKALELAGADPPPDIILLDVMMPGMDGYEVCRRLKKGRKTRDIPVIFITSMTDETDEAEGLALGAVDYIAKPVCTPVVRARVKTHLELKAAREQQAERNAELEERVVERTSRIMQLHREREESLKNFAAAVAHQLRNPVQAIGGMSGLMMKKLQPEHPAAEYAKVVREETLRLEKVADAVSEYTSLVRGTTDMVSASWVAEETARLGAIRAGECSAGLECAREVEETLLDVDPEFLLKALAELIRNAVDFRDGDTVKVRILGRTGTASSMSMEPESASGDSGEDVEISDDAAAGEVCESRETPEESNSGAGRYFFTIENKGSGIDEELLPFVRDPFFSTKALGVGMGLTKADRIAAELGGTLRIINTYDDAGKRCGVRATLDVPVL